MAGTGEIFVLSQPFAERGALLWRFFMSIVNVYLHLLSHGMENHA
jgi:hypothetical protein